MESLITGCHPIEPAQSSSVFDQGTGLMYETYGSHILDNTKYSAIDKDLRRMVAKCQAHCRHPLELPPTPRSSVSREVLPLGAGKGKLGLLNQD